MSKSLQDVLLKLAIEVGGGQGTINARIGTMKRFVKFLRKHNINIIKVVHIKAKYIYDYIQSRKHLSVLTLANEMSNFRTVLKLAGRAQVIEQNDLENADLGISGGSRIGKKLPCPEAVFQQFFNKSCKKDLGFAACLLLCFYLGLRREESIQSVKSINTWLRKLSNGHSKITVIFGTKNGKQRDVMIFNMDMSIKSLKFAKSVMKRRKGLLIDKPNLKKALTYFSNTARAIGLKGQLSAHSLRYAFAENNLKNYRMQGFTKKEAEAMTSMDLGHGDGRGRWVTMVYGRMIDYSELETD
jgi:site-specific recombinase XerD